MQQRDDCKVSQMIFVTTIGRNVKNGRQTYEKSISSATCGKLSDYVLRTDGVKNIQQKTRKYAKRQITFYKKLKKDLKYMVTDTQYVGMITDVNLTLCDLRLYIKQLPKDIYKIFYNHKK